MADQSPMRSAPGRDEHLIAAAWTASSAVPLFASVTTTLTVETLPADVRALDMTSLARFLSGMHALIPHDGIRPPTATGGSPCASTNRCVFTAPLPRAASGGSLFVGSGVLSESASADDVPLLRVAVLLVVPPDPQEDPGRSSPRPAPVYAHKRREHAYRTRLSRYVGALIDRLEKTLLPASLSDATASVTLRRAVVDAEDSARSRAAAYNAQTVLASGAVTLERWLVDTQAHVLSGMREESVCSAVLPPALWSSAVEGLHIVWMAEEEE